MPPFDGDAFEWDVKQAMHDSLKSQIAARLVTARPILDTIDCPVHGIGPFRAEVVDNGFLELGIRFDGCCQAGEEAASERIRVVIE